MIFDFFSFLRNANMDYCLINGYEELTTQMERESDIDILLKKNDFIKIEKIIKEFSKLTNCRVVQVLHHDLWAKNIFLFNPRDGEFLNLDLYGELSRKEVVFFEEEDIFSSLETYRDIPILSSEKEFINYLIKKLDKDDFTQENFDHLCSLFFKSTELCKQGLVQFFPIHYEILIKSFTNEDFSMIQQQRDILINDFYSLKKIDIKRTCLNTLRTVKRIMRPTGFSISFLGPDGSGKSTVINQLLDTRLPYRRKEYFHLKPIRQKNNTLVNNEVVADPHKYQPYSAFKSYAKLLYFICQYNTGWFRNIVPLKIRSSLVIFDRYFDDLLVDTRRYRYGGSMAIAKCVRKFIPKPDIYFILIADPKVIYERKQEVSFEELERQVKAYEALVDGKRYIHIDVDRKPEEITKEIITIMMEKMNERY